MTKPYATGVYFTQKLINFFNQNGQIKVTSEQNVLNQYLRSFDFNSLRNRRFATDFSYLTKLDLDLIFNVKYATVTPHRRSEVASCNINLVKRKGN